MTTDASVDQLSSKLGRLRSRLERGIRQPSMDQLRRPATLFRSDHRRKDSIDQITKDLSEASTRSRSSTAGSINLTPDIERVSNTSSPARSVISTDSIKLTRSRGHSPTKTKLHSQSSDSPSVSFVSSQVPRISITSGDDDNDNYINDKNSDESTTEHSKLARLRNRTISLFFDQLPSSSSTQRTKSMSPVRKRSLSIGEKSPLRPVLPRAHSDGKHETRNTITSPTEPHSNKSQRDIVRNRSRTMGSVDNDLYHKRNGSMAKTLGSMVMLKPRANTDVSHSPSSSSTSDLISRTSSLPEVELEDTPETYLEKLALEGYEYEVSSILANDDSEFFKTCLQTYIRQTFDFTADPLDFALRKFLLSCELPKEAQQIDRVLECFSQRYYDCNGDCWDNKDQIYFLTFSLVMLHTDHFNSNNKKKMTKEEFVKNTRVDDPNDKVNNAFMSRELFEYLFDNITVARFIQKNQVSQSTTVPPLYLLPKRIFSSSSSTNLESMTASPRHSTQRSQSISSTTSQFFNTTNIADPYFYLITNQVPLLRLSTDPLRVTSPFQSLLSDSFTESHIVNVRDALTDPNGTFLKFSKECNWLPGRTEIAFKGVQDINHSPFSLLRIVRVAELYREETVTNKFFAIGGSSRVIWKKCYGVLTLCGFFIFDNLNFIPLAHREDFLSVTSTSNKRTSPLIIDVVNESSLRSCKKLNLNGLFACQTGLDDTSFTFNLFSTNRKDILSCPTRQSVSLWVVAINFIAALDCCHIEYPAHVNHEVIPIRSTSIGDKANKLISNIPTSKKKIDDVLKVERHLGIVAPLANRTRDYLMQHYHALKVRIDWLWYEVERNQVYLSILRNELLRIENDDSYSVSAVDQETFLEDSFINDDVTGDADRSTHGKSKLNIVTAASDEAIEINDGCVLVNGDCSTEDIDAPGTKKNLEIDSERGVDALSEDTDNPTETSDAVPGEIGVKEEILRATSGASDDDDEDGDTYVDAETGIQ